MQTFQVRAIVSGRNWSHIFQANDILDAMDTIDAALEGCEYTAVEVTPL